MSNISFNTYGKDYADNIIDDLLQFNKAQTWTVSSGTGSGTINNTVLFEGSGSLELFNTVPTTDLTVTNSSQSTVIPYTGDFIFSCYIKKKDALEFFDVGIQLFQNAVPLVENVFTIGSEDADEDQNLEWVRFQSPVYSFSSSDVITFTFTSKAKVGTALSSSRIWVDGMMLNDANRLSFVVPTYTKPNALDSVSINVVTETATYTASNGDFVMCDASGGSLTVNLPSADDNFRIVVKKIDSSVNTVTIDGNGSETIDGDLTKIITNQYDSITLVSDGVNWFVI